MAFKYLNASSGIINTTTINLPGISFLEKQNNDDCILETDALQLANYLKKQIAGLTFYLTFLNSIAYENSLRYQNMQNATKNADRLIEQLQIEAQEQRQQKTTNEMIELAINTDLLVNTD